jgi:membrane protein
MNKHFNAFYKKASSFIKAFYTIFDQERILREASSLTFVTVLGFVPFILFLMTFLPDIPALNLSGQLKSILLSVMMPESADLFHIFIDDLFNNTITLNIFNIIMLVITSFSLFNSINTSFDRILKIHIKAKQSKAGTLLKLFGTIVLGFFIFTILFSTSSMPYIQSIFQSKWIRQVFSFLLPLILWFTLILLAYYFLPTARIRGKSVFVSASISAFAWFITKLSFDYYISHLTRMKQLYGIISSFPIFLFWIYLNWIFVLSGVIIIAILNDFHKNKKEFQVVAQIQFSVNKKVTKDYEKELVFDKNEEKQFKKFLSELLTKKNEKRN